MLEQAGVYTITCNFLTLKMLCRLIILLLLVANTATFGQKRKSSKNESQTTSVGPYYPDANKYSPKSKRIKSKDGISRQAQQQAKAQRGIVAKQKRKAERILESPNYGSTNYFGHKRTPRKRKPENMKYCNVCGIRH